MTAMVRVEGAVRKAEIRATTRAAATEAAAACLCLGDGGRIAAGCVQRFFSPGVETMPLAIRSAISALE